MSFINLGDVFTVQQLLASFPNDNPISTTPVNSSVTLHNDGNTDIVSNWESPQTCAVLNMSSASQAFYGGKCFYVPIRVPRLNPNPSYKIPISEDFNLERYAYLHIYLLKDGESATGQIGFTAIDDFTTSETFGQLASAGKILFQPADLGVQASDHVNDKCYELTIRAKMGGRTGSSNPTYANNQSSDVAIPFIFACEPTDNYSSIMIFPNAWLESSGSLYNQFGAPTSIAASNINLLDPMNQDLELELMWPETETYSAYIARISGGPQPSDLEERVEDLEQWSAQFDEYVREQLSSLGGDIATLAGQIRDISTILDNYDRRITALEHGSGGDGMAVFSTL